MEAPLALYRRYRPETFSEVIGQEHVTEPLRNALANNRVNHAYLFSGPRGCGKTTSARILARALNCEQGPVADPCGECDSCRELGRGGSGSIDVIEIDAASHNGVDDARELREKAFFAPVRSRYKVYIIDEAHMVTTAGFNALLKLVEEPPPHLRFIFATTEPDKVLATIRSRTHHYPFRLIPPRLLSSYLSDLCEREQVPIEPAALPLVVRAGGGSARDTLSVLDQLLGGAGDEGVTLSLATGLLGYTPDTLLDEVVDSFAARDGAAVFGVIDRVIESGQDPRRFTEDLLRRLRDLVIVDAVPDAPATGLIDVAQDAGERLVAQAARFGSVELSRAADLVAEGLTEMRGATAPRLLLELICARVLLPGAQDTDDGVMARLDRLEKRMQIAGGAPAEPEATPRARARAAARATTEQPAPAAPEPQPAPAARAPEPAPASSAPQSAPPSPPGGAAADAGAGAGEGPGPAVPPVDEAGAPDASDERAGRSEAPAPETAAPSASEPTGGLTLAEVRRLWPDIVEATKLRRRVTWIHLTQNAQVVGVDGDTLTLGFANAGARDSFVNGGSPEILRQAAIDVVGADWRVEAIIDQGARPSDPAAGGPAPAPRREEPAGQPSAPAPAPASSNASEGAREALQRTRETGSTGPGEPDPLQDADLGVDRDDPDVEAANVGGAELLQRELGAQVIEEIPHD